MDELALIAAAEWARANSYSVSNPIQFGSMVAQAYMACRETWRNSGDEKATAAALAALSIRPETLQAIALLSSLAPHPPEPVKAGQTDSAGAEA